MDSSSRNNRMDNNKKRYHLTFPITIHPVFQQNTSLQCVCGTKKKNPLLPGVFSPNVHQDWDHVQCGNLDDRCRFELPSLVFSMPIILKSQIWMIPLTLTAVWCLHNYSINHVPSPSSCRSFLFPFYRTTMNHLAVEILMGVCVYNSMELLFS